MLDQEKDCQQKEDSNGQRDPGHFHKARHNISDKADGSYQHSVGKLGRYMIYMSHCAPAEAMMVVSEIGEQ